MTIDEIIAAADGWQAGSSLRALADEITRLRTELAHAEDAARRWKALWGQASTGMIQCECGGDLCVCHHHGEYECPGCDECDGDDDNGFGDCDYGDD